MPSSSSRPAGFTAVVFGMLAMAAIPVGIVLAWQLQSVKLLPALVVSVPVAFVLSLFGISAARRARFKVDRSVFRVGDRTARIGKFFVWAGFYFAIIGALALGFYGAIRSRS
jgi:hypothetical protein